MEVLQNAIETDQKVIDLLSDTEDDELPSPPTPPGILRRTEAKTDWEQPWRASDIEESDESDNDHGELFSDDEEDALMGEDAVANYYERVFAPIRDDGFTAHTTKKRKTKK